VYPPGMTATHVDGVEVVTSEQATSPLPRTGSSSEPILYTRVMRLFLADGTETFGCVDCDYTDPMIGRVRMHVNKVHTEGEERKFTVPTGLTVVELLERFQR